MTDNYSDIKSKLTALAQQDNDMTAVIAIGSSTRKNVPSDEYSDLDLIIVTSAPESWYSGEYPKKLGDVRISFIEPTLGGGKERRAIYDEGRDVDMLIFTPEQFEKCLREGVAQWVMNRGYSILYAHDALVELIKEHIRLEVSPPDMSGEEFLNMVNDFYFHNIWAYKKLRRGEIWSAKMCVDGYLKDRLLKVAELYCVKKHGKDVWHDGRFFDRWADEDILAEIRQCFARYDAADIETALYNTHKLFARLARELAAMLNVTYPETAEETARSFCGFRSDDIPF
ncbi:aminoglycoside 6-adenylyltransferase [uncultured Ruminococcus sp.]|uniref:aminoglycoside 6-adenylyltransferase n=1 Tax=uncultured Ruminococcus sp. TaxID=165186 RepID=UPI0025D5A3D3|nr:aminoglycoside 6-adenylyltransferase [uncultured Ruminococcus sp.]